MEPHGVEAVHELLRRGHIAEIGKAVVLLRELQPRRAHLPRQPVVPIAAKLEAKGRPGRDAQMAEPELLIQHIDIEVLALARPPLQAQRPAGLGRPHPQTAAALHRPEHADDAGVPPALLQQLRDEFLLALPGLHLPHHQPLLARHLAHAGVDLLLPLLGFLLGELQVRNPIGAQIAAHRLRPPDGLISPGQQDAVVTFEHALDVLGMLVQEGRGLHAPPLPQVLSSFRLRRVRMMKMKRMALGLPPA